MSEQMTLTSLRAPLPKRIWAPVRRALLLAAPGATLLCFWQFASGRLIRETYVSKPTEIAWRLVDLFYTGEIWPSLRVTGEELVLSYAIGVLLGLLLGYALGRSPRLASIFEPYVMAFYGIPKIALAPLFVIWFGIGIWSKVMLAGTMVFFLVFYNVFAGVRSVDRDVVNLALVLGANERQLGRQIYLPAAAPFLMLGMRMAIPYAVIGVIVGEFTSSTAGLGLFINYASSTYDPAGVFAGIFILLAFVMGMNALANRLERKLLKWQPTSQRIASEPN
jgi:NitT/TauT family transport system permease protein